MIIVSDDMVIVGMYEKSNITARSAREEFVLREQAAKTLFYDSLHEFRVSRYLPSNEVKYVMSRGNSILRSELTCEVNKILIAIASDGETDSCSEGNGLLNGDTIRFKTN